jgi:hypothetical protein
MSESLLPNGYRLPASDYLLRRGGACSEDSLGAARGILAGLAMSLGLWIALLIVLRLPG